jgi:predicted nucleic acid-binding protein
MDRLFLDANVLFSAAYKTDARLREFWKLKDVVLCSSRYALEEARSNLVNEDQKVRLHNLSGDFVYLTRSTARFLVEFLFPKKMCRSFWLPWKLEPLIC